MTKNGISIRHIMTDDYDKLRELYFKIQTEEFPWVHNALLSDFDNSTQGEIVFIALFNGEITGFISVWEEDRFIHNLFVSKEYRKHGIGKALINQTLLAFGTPLTLKCVKENKSAVNFYLANGWKIQNEEIGTEGTYYLMSYNFAN